MFSSHVAPSQVAAIVFEPQLGEGGFVPAPPEFVEGLRRICDREGIVMIADEVQTGFGRTGRMFAMEHYAVEPDLITVAKSIAGGLPLSGVIGKAEIMDAPHTGAIGGTFIGNPVALAAALAVLDVFAEEDLVARANTIGDRIRERMLAWQVRWPRIGDVRGLGAMLAIELVHDPAHEGSSPDARRSGDRSRPRARADPPQGGDRRKLHPRPLPADDRGRGSRRGPRRLGTGPRERPRPLGLVRRLGAAERRPS